jgi:predicted GIY-YIG superfamily endonuclease
MTIWWTVSATRKCSVQPKYKRMLKGMLRKERCPRDTWFVYILECSDSTFYTGVTKDLDRRLTMHNNGKASRYTRIRRPVAVVYYEKLKGRAKALSRECRIKAMPRPAKEKLINKGDR